MLRIEYNNEVVVVSWREVYVKGVGKDGVWNRTGNIYNGIDVDYD